jgi:hypothetical protein
MIKKLFLIIIVGMLVFSGVQAINISKSEKEITDITKNITFLKQPITEKKDSYLSVQFEGTNALLKETGKPMLPVYLSTFTFSQNVKIKSISCTYSNLKEKSISGKVIPTPEPVPYSFPDSEKIKSVYNEDKEIYENEALYPSNWYEYKIRCGLNSDSVSTTFVTVEIHPVRYSPKQNMLYYTSDFEIQICYVDPLEKTITNADYDLVIITPSIFTNELQPLVDHKISHDVKTILKTTEEIYAEYQGRDKPEQIKYFIKDAKETWNINYVLLVGGLKSYLYNKDKDNINQGSTAWYLPVRYANIKHSDETGCISDLYYSDLYRYNETTQTWEFEDWDSNGDGIFAKMTGFVTGNDKLDLVPDVYYGRLACINKFEVKTMVNKIIAYESTSPAEKPWFKKMIGVGGRTFDLYEGEPDGEYACDVAINYMGNLINEAVRVYASNEGTSEPTIPDDVIPEISKGAGYVLFQGHGNPSAWNTHPPDTTGEWMGATMVYQFLKFSNKEKLPVILVGGCHNALFNVSILPILLNRENTANHYWTAYPIPVCFSWGLCIVPKGGAIASTGCTGYGFGTIDDTGFPTDSGALETYFFYEIGQEGATTLGSAHSGSLRKFFLENPVRQDEAFCTTIWQLFGDPSLQLGGFS